MGFFDKVKDVLTTSDAERAQKRDASDRDGAPAGQGAADTPGHDAAVAAGKAGGAETGAGAAGVEATEATAAPYRTHTVRRGDTLASIAEHYGVDAGAMAELNRIDNPDLIYPGQVFRVPHA